MATLLIRNLDDAVRDKLRVRAAERGRSMEAEAREILAGAVVETEDDANAESGSGAVLLARLREGMPPGGVEFKPFPDQPYAPRNNAWDEAE